MQYLYQFGAWHSLQFDMCKHMYILCRNPFHQCKGRGQEEQKLDMSGVWLISTKGQIGTYCSTECSLPPGINEPRRRKKLNELGGFSWPGFDNATAPLSYRGKVPPAIYLLLIFNRICFKISILDKDHFYSWWHCWKWFVIQLIAVHQDAD